MYQMRKLDSTIGALDSRLAHHPPHLDQTMSAMARGRHHLGVACGEFLSTYNAHGDHDDMVLPQ